MMRKVGFEKQKGEAVVKDNAARVRGSMAAVVFLGGGMYVAYSGMNSSMTS